MGWHRSHHAPQYRRQPPPTSLSNFDAFRLWERVRTDKVACCTLRRRGGHRSHGGTHPDAGRKAACGPHGCTTRRRSLPLYVNVGVLVSENLRGGAFSINVSFYKLLRDVVSDRELGRGDVGHQESRNARRGRRLHHAIRVRTARSVHLGISARERNRLPVMASA